MSQKKPHALEKGNEKDYILIKKKALLITSDLTFA